MNLKSLLQTGFLVGVGCLQLGGDLIGNDTIKALGAMTHASPAPKVFTAQNGFETYSPRFIVTAIDAAGKETAVRLTPQVNARVRGPYNRRNAYGAAISYGPVLASSAHTRPMFEAAFYYGFCNARGIVAEVGLPEVARYRVTVQPRKAAAHEQWPTRFEVDCRSARVTTS